MNILLDVNIVLDALVPQRGYQSQAEASLSTLQKAGYFLFFSASSVDNTAFMLTRYLKRESEAHARLREFVRQYGVHLLSVIGQDFLELEACTDLEDALLSTTAKRVDSDFVVLTRDSSFDHQGLRTISYEDVDAFVQQTTEVKQIPLLDLRREYQHMMEELDHAALSVLAHARYILGPEVAQFEQECAEYLGVKHAIGCASGTDALVLALRALAIQRKGQEYWDRSDLIITTPFTFTATGDAILRAGATPLFVDVDPETFNLDPEKVRENLNSDTWDSPSDFHIPHSAFRIPHSAFRIPHSAFRIPHSRSPLRPILRHGRADAPRSGTGSVRAGRCGAGIRRDVEGPETRQHRHDGDVQFLPFEEPGWFRRWRVRSLRSHLRVCVFVRLRVGNSLNVAGSNVPTFNLLTFNGNPTFNGNEDFGLRDQIRRAAVSVPSNIAEGFDRQSNKEFLQFLNYAKGSVAEVRTQLYIAQQLGYLQQNVFENLKEQTESLSSKIGKFISYLKRARKPANA